jgi:hypothetical protein
MAAVVSFLDGDSFRRSSGGRGGAVRNCCTYSASERGPVVDCRNVDVLLGEDMVAVKEGYSFVERDEAIM